MVRVKLITLSLIIMIGLCMILPHGGSTDNHARYFYIGRSNDTIKVYGNTTLIKELVKINGNWYLYGDTNAIVTNVEIIQHSNVRLKSLVFNYEGITYEFDESNPESIITNSN